MNDLTPRSPPSTLLHHYEFERHGPNESCNRAAHRVDELRLATIGHGEMRIGSATHIARVGTAVFVPAGVEHSGRTRHHDYAGHCVHFCAEDLDALADAMGLAGARPQIGCVFTTSRVLADAVGALRRERAAPPAPGRQLLLDSLMCQVGVSVLRSLTRHETPRCESRVRDRHVRLELARELLDATGGEGVTLAKLAEVAELSKYHFLRAFRARFGVTPHRYLVDARLRRAELLMRTTDASLTTIAADVGFASAGKLSLAFRRRHGVPPSRWRRMEY